jgi:phosphatidyl-myo-inositol dimannoside synthase
VFVTRRFPPSIGGMETLAAEVYEALARTRDVELISLGATSLLHLAWFLPWALIRTAASLARGGVERVVCGDAVAWAAVSPAVRAARAQGSAMVMGLDLSYENRIYHAWIGRTLPNADRVVAISEATAQRTLAFNLDPSRLRIVNPGIRRPAPDISDRKATRAKLVSRLDIDPEKLILVTLGRLVRRKGVAWFVEAGMPELANVATYLVAGDGRMRPEVEAAIRRADLRASVQLLGTVDEALKDLLLQGADIAILPNVSVPGDIEGFGQVAVEASCNGALVVAAAIDGLVEAVANGETGILVEAGRAERFVEIIREFATDRKRLAELAANYQREALERFSLERMGLELPDALGLS